MNQLAKSQTQKYDNQITINAVRRFSFYFLNFSSIYSATPVFNVKVLLIKVLNSRNHSVHPSIEKAKS